MSAQHDEDREPIADLIERSSLGSPAAKRMRARVSDEQVQRVLDLVAELDSATTDPQRLADALDATVRGWAATTGQTPPAAVFCAVENEITGALCSRICCDGNHDAEGESWGDTTDTEESP